MPEKDGAQRTYRYTSLLHRLETDKKAVKILRTKPFAVNVNTIAADEIYWNKREGFFTWKKRFNFQVFRLEHNNGCRFIVLVKQYGGRDVPQLFLESLLVTWRSAIG